MELIKRKIFWYALIALLVFFTDIWIYFHLKKTRLSAARAATVQEKQLSQRIILDLILKTQNEFLLDHASHAQNSLRDSSNPSEVQDEK
ncbi:MAG: hypothetical protein JNL11_09065 [Bdellovibrionaceae bacterium]|nr:hypothetical protein [Pseudobdellovibrionaceae bacterium]